MNIMKQLDADPAVLALDPPGEDGWLTPAQVAALTPELVRERVRALLPLIAEHAPEAERMGRPHPLVWEELRKTGFLYHFMPKAYGGCEFSATDFFLTSAVIAQACASTAWAFSFTVEHNWIASLFPKQAQDEFFAGGRYMVAPAVTNPMGRAVRVEGGYRLTAQWRYGSGVMNSNWCMGAAIIEGDDPPVPHWFAFPADEIQVLDCWKVDGLIGTGSNDIVVTDLFVPEHMQINFAAAGAGSSPGGELHPNPLYHLPVATFLSLVVVSTIIGAARGAVEIFRERLKTRKVVGSSTPLFEKANMQVLLARADLMARTAELYLAKLGDDLLDLAVSNRTADGEARCAIVAQAIFAGRMARDATRLVVDNSGTAVHFLSDPLQRIMRDVNTASSHLAQDFELIAEQHGRFMLGMAPTAFNY